MKVEVDNEKALVRIETRGPIVTVFENGAVHIDPGPGHRMIVWADYDEPDVLRLAPVPTPKAPA